MRKFSTFLCFRAPWSPQPSAQFGFASCVAATCCAISTYVFFAPLSRSHLQNNFSTCRFFSRPLVATAFCAICVATSIAQFQHIDLILPLAHFQHVSFLFAPLGRHIHCASSTHLLFRFPLVATFLFFRAPGCPNLLSNSRFGYGLLFSYSAERVRRNLGRIVCVLDRVPPKPLRNLYKCFTCFFSPPLYLDRHHR